METMINITNSHSQEALQYLPVAIIIIFIGYFIKNKSRLLAAQLFCIGIIWIVWAFIGLYQL